MRFELLGPVRALTGDGRELGVGGPKPRALLAALLLARGRMVPADRLARVIWDDSPPDTAAGVVQSYVSRLRRALADGAQPPVLATRPPGYLLDPGAATLDLVEFEQLTELARQHTAAGAVAAAAEALAQALALWQGPALSGLPGLFCQTEAARLEDLRWSAVEDRAEALLALGRSAEVAGELGPLVAEQPLRQRLRGQLMLALFRAGRQAGALEVYRQGRRVMVDELGLEPGQELQRLQEAIVRCDEALHSAPAAVTAAVPEPAPPVEDWARPGQLPPDIADFIGRAEHIAVLRAALTAPDRRATPICLISGMSGVGKSTLAVRVAHEVRTGFPDGQLHVDLGAVERAHLPVAEVLARFLRATGLPTTELPDSAEERLGLFRTRLATRRVLLVLDNVADLAQLNLLTPGAPGCGVLVTSRRRLLGVPGAVPVELDALCPDEALELLGAVAGQARVVAEPEAARRVVDLGGGLPLAVRTAGTKLVFRPQWTLGQLVERLDDERRRLDELAVGDLKVRPSIALAVRGLPEPARRAFRRLSLLDLPTFPAWVLGAALDLPPGEAEALLDELLDGYLVDFAGVDRAGQARYRIHDLVRLLGRELGEADETAADRAALLVRVISGWLTLVRAASAEVLSGALPLLPVVEPGWHPPEEAVRAVLGAPGEWLETEQLGLTITIEQATEHGLGVHACALATALLSFLTARQQFAEWLRARHVALEAVRRAEDRRAEAALLVGLGHFSYERERFTEACEHFEQAIHRFEADGERRGVAIARSGLATVRGEQGHFADALALLALARPALAEAGDTDGLAYLDNRTARMHLELGEFELALEVGQRVLSAYRAMDHLRGQGWALRNLGLVHRAVGDWRRAAELSEQSLAVFTGTGDRLAAAYAQQALGKALLRQGQTERARLSLDEALATVTELRDEFGQALLLRTLAELCLASGALSAADAYVREAERRWRALDMPLWRARTLLTWAELDRRAGFTAAAESRQAEALRVFTDLGSREAAELSPRALGIPA
ncbi:DNA-binding SARP family transcriptional activator [Crossiella equi]|uniref:DNA-binding SARP family transcriptional activator n=1 Tax=Crossiella equi TaxID=130796 RepID=A0ABS5A8Z6_9PSEU|nr:BTAD domain-containing putative transcriptional regulator [Crossiella equi]MBP2472195.1 DNA-binding SARP family transcriptional activator [Crossiella equi]